MQIFSSISPHNKRYLTNPFRAENDAKILMKELVSKYGFKPTTTQNTDIVVRRGLDSEFIQVSHKSMGDFIVTYSLNGIPQVNTKSSKEVLELIKELS